VRRLVDRARAGVRLSGFFARTFCAQEYAVARRAANTPLPFTVYDATLFTGKPDTSAYGLVPFETTYNWSAYPNVQVSDFVTRAQEFVNSTDRYTIDIEDYPVDIRQSSAQDVANTVALFRAGMVAWRSTSPGGVNRILLPVSYSRLPDAGAQRARQCAGVA
jgi:hypothetical protein